MCDKPNIGCAGLSNVMHANKSTPVVVAWSIYDASVMTVVATISGSPMHLGRMCCCVVNVSDWCQWYTKSVNIEECAKV